MKAAFLLLAALLFVSGAPVAGPLKEAQASYVQITDMDGSHYCGATKIDTRTVVTAEHCVTAPILVQGQIPERIVLDGAEHALVVVPKPLKGKSAKLARRLPDIGDAVYVWGMPGSLGPLWREGVYMGQVELTDMFPTTWKMMSGLGRGGDSGSGIFDERGRLVGSVSIGLFATFFREWAPLGWHDYKFTDEQWREAK